MRIHGAIASRRLHLCLRASLVAAVMVLAVAGGTAGQPAPGEVVIAWHVTIAPSWFDPSTAPAADHARSGFSTRSTTRLVRPLPGQKMGNSLAESWTESPDGLRYEFKLRRGLKFHNGDPVTTEDVKFSFERYKGAGANELQARVRQVEIVDPLTVRFHLKEPWPDFMTFYGTTATAAGLVVPKKYLTQVGRRGLPQASDRRRPLSVREPQARRGGGAGGESRVLAARALRQAADHEERPRGDDARGDAEEGRGRHRLCARRRGRRERATRPAACARALQARVDLLDRVRRAVGPEVPVGRQAGAAGGQLRAEPQGRSTRWPAWAICPPTGVIVPRVMDFALQAPPPPYDPQKAKQLLAEAGYPERHRRGRVRADPAVLHGGRGGRELPQRGRDPARRSGTMERAAFLRRLAGEEAARAVPRRRRQLGQRGQPRGGLHVLQGELRLRRLSRHRRSVPAAGDASGTSPGARRCSTASSSSPSTA